MAVPQPLVTIRLEPGYKFRPTDEDIVVHYLRPRALNIPPPAPVIVDVDILNHNPWDLVPEGSLEKYYFSKRVPRWPGGNRSKRAAGDGHWKPSGREVPIYSNAVNGRYPVMVGMKKTMVFYRGKAPAGEITEWVMQEYSLFQAGLMPCRVMRRPTCNCAAAVIAKRNDALSQALRNANANLVTPVVVKPDDSWVVCRIYKKKKCTPRVIARGYNVAGGGQVPFFDFIGQGGNNPDGTSSSSTLTGPPYEMEDDDTDDDESSSSSEKDCSSEGN